MLNRRTMFVAGLTLVMIAAVLPAEVWAEPGSGVPAKYRAAANTAIAKGLEFLAGRQSAAHARGPAFSCGREGKTNAVAGLVGMALLSGGHSPKSGRFGGAVSACVDQVLASQRKDGYLGAAGGRMRAHGIATLFLIKVSGKVDAGRQKKIDALLPKAIKVIVDAQNAPKKDKMYHGGWRNEPTADDSDITVTGWQLQALRAAQRRGLSVPAKTIADAVAFIERCVWEDDGGFRYDPVDDWVYKPRGLKVHNPSTPLRTGVGILCRELTGHHADEINKKAGIYVLKSNRGKGKFLGSGGDAPASVAKKTDAIAPPSQMADATYYCSQAMFQLGGPYWKRFAPAMYDYVLARQQPNGSWLDLNDGEVIEVSREGDRCSACPTALNVLALTVSSGQVSVPHVIGSHMVLQRDIPITIWGWAGRGDAVTVELAGNKTVTAADASGEWKVKLPKMKAGGPHKMIISGKNTITLTDILVGEVWVCSGQSNMQWGVNGSNNAGAEIAGAKFPKIRLFTVPNVMKPEPQLDCNGRWTTCSPRTVAGFSAVGYFYGRELHKKLGVPVGLINTSWGGSVAEAWTSKKTLASDPDFAQILARSRGNLWNGTGMFNAMINPLIPFGIRGAIWYQGESNVSRAFQYRKLFPAMIRDWRTHWGQGDFPFYFVQLAPFNYGGFNTACAELWEAQAMTLSLANTGMAVTTDIGHTGNIHPTNKQDVGKRLALWAFAKTYGVKDITYSGPLYKSMKVEGGAIRLKFDHDAGLASRDGQPLSWFTIAGADRKFYTAVATVDGNTLLVSGDDVPKPVAVRFAWSGVAQPSFVNKAGLPASPFRTDDWPATTAGAK